MKKLLITGLLLITSFSIFSACEVKSEGQNVKKPKITASPFGDLIGHWKGSVLMVVGEDIESCVVELKIDHQNLIWPYQMNLGKTKISCQSMIVEYDAASFSESESSEYFEDELIDVYRLEKNNDDQGWVSRDYRIMNLDYHNSLGNTRLIIDLRLDSKDRMLLTNLMDIYEAETNMFLIEESLISYQGEF